MVNDAVSIILYKAIEEMFDSPNLVLEWYSPLLLIWKFIENCVLSVFVGTAIGLLSTLIFKRFRFLTYSTTSETVFAFLMAYFGYGLCEVFELSGVIGLLMCGIIMSHY
jgi:NhaP-type Na+/H+ or K+/H+ antiporter